MSKKKREKMKAKERRHAPKPEEASSVLPKSGEPAAKAEASLTPEAMKRRGRSAKETVGGRAKGTSMNIVQPGLPPASHIQQSSPEWQQLYTAVRRAMHS